eukprot:m.247830 g.247830  ORF g.247830 m.247830 type:complete len:60 (+) comp15864_c0_seq5:2509-2688(+)
MRSNNCFVTSNFSSFAVNVNCLFALHCNFFGALIFQRLYLALFDSLYLRGITVDLLPHF